MKEKETPLQLILVIRSPITVRIFGFTQLLAEEAKVLACAKISEPDTPDLEH